MLSPNAIAMFKDYITILRELGTLVIVPGNHDNNVTFQSDFDKIKIDSLESILSDNIGLNKDLFYISKTGRFKVGNIIFYHVSVFDLDKNYKPEDYNERKKFLKEVSKISNEKYKKYKHVGLFHCGIENQKLQNGYILKDCAYKISDLENYDIVCLGDTHEHQFLGEKRNLAYPSSLVQQSFGESIDKHGIIQWDLDNLKGEFIEIKNDYGYVTVKNDDLNKINFPKKSRIKLEYCYENETLDIKEIQKKIELKTEIISWKEKRYSDIKKIKIAYV